jgi:hypothetical protein
VLFLQGHEIAQQKLDRLLIADQVVIDDEGGMLARRDDGGSRIVLGPPFGQSCEPNVSMPKTIG